MKLQFENENFCGSDIAQQCEHVVIKFTDDTCKIKFYVTF